MDAEVNLKEVQNKISIFGLSEGLFHEKLAAYEVLDGLLQNQKLLLWDKCKMRWLYEGDMNAFFFNSMLPARKVN